MASASLALYVLLVQQLLQSELRVFHCWHVANTGSGKNLPFTVCCKDITVYFFYFFLVAVLHGRARERRGLKGWEGTWQVDACSSARITRTISTGRNGKTELWSTLVRAGARAFSSCAERNIIRAYLARTGLQGVCQFGWSFLEVLLCMHSLIIWRC